MGLTRPQFKIITLFALLTLGGVFPVQADENALHRAQFGSQSTLLAVIIDFERYRNGLGDRHLHQQLDTHLTRFRQHFETLSSIQPRLAEARRAALKQQWQRVARRLGAWLVTIEQGGFIDQEITYQYQEEMTAFWDQLSTQTSSSGLITPSEESILLLQHSNLRYLNAHWKLAPYAHHHLTELVALLDRQVQILQPRTTDLQRKWALLKRALLQEDRSMGFIVNRYSGALIELLEPPLTTDF
ncbi:MAG TPA: hypothetical protein DEP79_00010 [Gammaproteobacteria bacterium]|nr:hypothetical protein [Gammaproteobacteria bacterium]